jgi:hypothetical protein
MENKERKDNRISNRIWVHVAVALYGLACIWLYYHQSLADLNGVAPIAYQSDLPAHLSMVLQDHWYYSFTAYAYVFLSWLCNGNTIGIALFLAGVTVASVYATENLLCLFVKEKAKTWGTLALALSLNFVMPIFIRVVGEFRYVSYQSPNVWHNSTYLCMKLVALITIWYYFRLAEHYEKGISLKEWIIFMLLNVLCTGIKPSFLLAFSPIMGIFLLVDLFRKVPLKNILIFGSALLPSGLVILWQNAVLFGDDTGNGMGFDPWYSFSLHTNIPKLAVICSALFCVLVVAATILKDFKDRQYLFVLCMTALGFLEALCLVENGSRSVDGNFLWGYGFCLFVLFVLCAVKCVESLWSKDQTMARRIPWIAFSIVYAWHLWCGIFFFVRLLLGEGFFMR